MDNLEYPAVNFLYMILAKRPRNNAAVIFFLKNGNTVWTDLERQPR